VKNPLRSLSFLCGFAETHDQEDHSFITRKPPHIPVAGIISYFIFCEGNNVGYRPDNDQLSLCIGVPGFNDA
jgi:hypothetical protein